MSAMMNHVKLIVRKPIDYGYRPELAPAATCMLETVTLEKVQWFFPESTCNGIESHNWVPLDPNTIGGCIVSGYRCPICLKVFFVSDILDLNHECNEGTPQP